MEKIFRVAGVDISSGIFNDQCLNVNVIAVHCIDCVKKLNFPTPCKLKRLEYFLLVAGCSGNGIREVKSVFKNDYKISPARVWSMAEICPEWRLGNLVASNTLEEVAVPSKKFKI